MASIEALEELAGTRNNLDNSKLLAEAVLVGNKRFFGTEIFFSGQWDPDPGPSALWSLTIDYGLKALG